MTSTPNQPGSWPTTDDDLVDAATRATSVFEAKVAAEGERLKSLNEREVEAAKAQHAADQADNDEAIAWATANRQADIDTLKTFYESMSKIAVDGIDRARSAAELVQKASATVVTLYTGTLALVFSVSDNPLPTRGVLAPLFLGLAVVLSTAFVAYLGPTTGVQSGPAPAQGLEPKVFQRLNTMIRVSNRIASRRSWCLRASVVALGVGLVFIAAPFISFATEGEPTASVDDATSSETEWPPMPRGNPDLAKILYQAQVDEALRARGETTSITESHDGTVLLLGLLLGSALVVIVPSVARERA